MLVFFYILHVTILILHEIESGYEKEWEILKLPVKLTGFIILHIPMMFLFFYGLYFIIQYPQTRVVISIISGIIGLIPFLVHKILKNEKEHFNKTISNTLIFGNIITGVILIVIGLFEI
jgi:uncharacterized membrane protein